jgi:hypothetical protein
VNTPLNSLATWRRFWISQDHSWPEPTQATYQHWGNCTHNNNSRSWVGNFI